MRNILVKEILQKKIHVFFLPDFWILYFLWLNWLRVEIQPNLIDEQLLIGVQMFD
jgi:hypothetical protein